LGTRAKVLSAGKVPDGFFWQDIGNAQIAMTYVQLQGLSSAIRKTAKA